MALFLGGTSLSHQPQQAPKSSPKFSIASLAKEIRGLKLGWGQKTPKYISEDLFSNSIANSYRVLPNGDRVDVDLRHAPANMFIGSSKSYIRAMMSQTSYIDIRIYNEGPVNQQFVEPAYRYLLFTPSFKKSKTFAPVGFSAFVEYPSDLHGNYYSVTATENGTVQSKFNNIPSASTSNHATAEHVFIDIQKQALKVLDSVAVDQNPKPPSVIKIAG
jgi:hypothetical protein